MRITEVLNAKGSTTVVTVPPEASMAHLLQVLARHNIGAVVVSADGRRVDGIVSERDVVRRMAGGDIEGVTVEEIMTSDVHTCSPDDDLEGLMVLMTAHRIRHVPVVVGGELAGLVSIGDAVKRRIDALEFERDQLQGYVSQAQ